MKTHYLNLEKQFDRLKALGVTFDRARVEKFIEDYAKTILLWRDANQRNIARDFELMMNEKLEEMVDAAESECEENKKTIKTLNIPDYTLLTLFRTIRIKYPENYYNIDIKSP